MEEELCQSILKALGAFDYIAASKLISKINKIYPLMGSILTRLCNCENSFTQLQFLRSRYFFMRKDTSVEVVYTTIANEIPREIQNIDSSALSVNDKSSIMGILSALEKFCCTRRDMITIYQSILAQSIKGEFQDILIELESVQKRTIADCLGADLGILGIGVEKEINILTSLLKARTAIMNYAFQDSCILLYSSKQELTEWKRACQEQDYPEKSSSRPDETKEISPWVFSLFGPSESKILRQGDVWPNTIRWHTRVLGNLTAKMTLYFNTILLEKECILNEEDANRSLWKGLRIDYHEQISSFRKKYNAHSLGIVYEVSDSIPFYPQGYVCSGIPYEPPQGIHSFPFIYCYPKDTPNKHLPSIISIIQGSKRRLSNPKNEPVYFYDNTIGSTYYLMRVDDHAVFVIIYLEKHNHRDTATVEFITHIVTSLRGSTVIEELIKVD
ncbi:hypothetical protein BDB01DRAFT_784917 [Pilobolus umbonatus]|nr:hypothetical protein BDB01DRAFT_784917 [Pilobolus umbonatus]